MTLIALRMLVGDTVKWLGVVLGVFFCTFLITHLLSMLFAMFDRTYATISDIPQADIWVMDPATEWVDEPAGLSDTALDRVRGVEGVAWATPLVTVPLRTRLLTGQSRSVLVIGIDDASLVGAPEHLAQGSIDSLRSADAVIVDEASANGLLRIALEPPPRRPGWDVPDFTVPTRPLRVGDEMLINDHRAIVVGVAKLTTRFLSRAVAYTTYTNALKLAPPQRNLTSFVLVKAADGRDPRAVAARIAAATGLRARTARDFSQDTVDYVVKTSGVLGRIIFMVGVGVVVGICVSGLLLFLFTAENARYYATLKALGAGDRQVALMVVVQAALSGVMGYGLGVGFSSLLSRIIVSSAMPYRLTWFTLGFTALAVLVVSTFSAVLSSIKVMRVEPAMVFK